MKPSDQYSRLGPRLFTVKEAAKFLGCSERKLWDEIKAGIITYREPPQGLRFAEVDLLDRLRPKGGPGAKKGFKDPLIELPVRRSPVPTSQTGNLVQDVSRSTPACVLSMTFIVVFGNQNQGFQVMEVQSR